MGRKNEEELRKMHWRDRYEYEARRQAEAFDNYDEQRLVARIEKNLLDSYFAIWRAIGRKGTDKLESMVHDDLQNSDEKRRVYGFDDCDTACPI